MKTMALAPAVSKGWTVRPAKSNPVAAGVEAWTFSFLGAAGDAVSVEFPLPQPEINSVSANMNTSNGFRLCIRRRISFCQDGFDNLFCQVRLFGKRLLGGFFSLADQLAVELQPGAFLFHHIVLDADIQNAAFF